MTSIGCKIWILLVTTTIQDVLGQNTGQGISLSVSPGDGKSSVGSDIRLDCTLDVSIVGDIPIVWSRITGDLVTNIAKGTRNEDEFVSQHRYVITKGGMVNQKITYSLSISDLHLEDSGTFRCAVMGSSRSSIQPLAVCADTSSKSCACVLEKGWASPACFGESKSEEELRASYHTTITGIGVCFAIAVLYGVGITVLFSRDCVRILHLKKKRSELRRQMLSQGRAPNPYAESEKLTFDPNDDAASVPESGVWSQSEGSSNRNSGRENGGPPGFQQPSAGNIVRSRPRPRQISHVNAAYDPDGTEKVIVEKPPRHEPPTIGVGAIPKVTGGGDLGISSPFSTSQPRLDQPAPPYPTTSTNTVPSAPVLRPRTPPERPRLPVGLRAPGSAQSEGRGRSPDPYPVESRQVYTDVTKEPQGYQGNHRNYTEPRKLDFVPQNVNYDRNRNNYQDEDGIYIANHDTEI